MFVEAMHKPCIKNSSLLYFVSIFICATLIMADSIDPDLKHKIDQFIEDVYLPANNNPALSLGIASGNGSLLYSRGFGLMDIENQQLTTNQTLFLIGSMSKSFAAVIVCKTLHEQFPELGSKVLDTPVNKLVPGFNFTLNDRFRSEATTFRDMLSHRVCSKPDGMATLMVPFKTPSEVAYRQRYADEQCGFRTGLVYNNGMYALIASAIETIANQSYENLILELLHDLEMYNSTIVRENDDDKPPNRAIPYYWRHGEKHNFNPKLLKRVSIAAAAGGIVSNAVDIIKYLQFHLNKGKVGSHQIVPVRVMEWLYQIAIQFPIAENNFKPHETDVRVGYGLGLYQAISDGWQRIGHGGSVPPFLSEMSVYPAKNIGIFTATNQMPENSILNHSRLHRAIFDILRGVESPTIRGGKDFDRDEFTNKIVLHHPKTHSVKNMSRFTGVFGNGLQGEIEITTKLRNETNTTELYMNYGTWGQAYLLETEEELQFLVSWDSDVVQDKYAFGLNEYYTFVIFSKDLNEVQIIDNSDPSGKFIRDVSLDDLPRIPWNPDSCGPSR